jgi:hypothetical protein
LPVINTLAYFASSSAIKKKSFITMTPGRHQLVGSGHLSAVQWPSLSGKLFLQQSFGKKKQKHFKPPNYNNFTKF